MDAPLPPVEPDLEEAEVTVEGAAWKVRVVGRAGGARPSDTPLILLGFWPEQATEGDRVREALVVGRSLAEMTAGALQSAFSSSTPPPTPRDPASDADGRGRRRHGGRGRGRGRGS
ncbi:MAG: hypothetical protein HKO77_07055 [Gemmatimonadetes bacterium]|nr:hypothetical protein [Gemmatimonadota bacterium]